MERLINVVNKLHDVTLMTGKESLQLPQIVVVGDQSSGKSSVLESLVGKSFLPRGTGVVTRRPLLIHLEHLAINKGDNDELGSVDHVAFKHTDKVFYDFLEVMKEIEDATNKVAGTNKGICSEPIIMTIYSKNAASKLTLIDLPGIVRVPMGDQPQDIEVVLKNLILEYISNPNSIILAVVTANTDTATSESLKIAKEVDPNGERTLAVVTKLDIMDQGTDALELLSGKVIPVKLGVVGVVNRSHRDTLRGKTIRDALLDETMFFFNRYPQIANKHGISYLARSLQVHLIQHIRNRLPQLRESIQEGLEQYMGILDSLPASSIPDPNESLLSLLTAFSSGFCDKIQGTCGELETDQLGGGARISYIFHEIFANAINYIKPLMGYSRTAIITAMKNSAGAKPSLFVPENCFEMLVKKQIVRLEVPSIKCVQLVYEEMEKIVYSCCQDPNIGIIRFPRLYHKVLEVVIGLMKNRLPEATTLVQQLIDIQGAYINTAHPDFKKLGSETQENERQIVPFKENEYTDECGLVERLVTNYFNIVKKQIQDVVPKAIMHCLVNYTMEHILSELVSKLYSPNDAAAYLKEAPAVTERRNYAYRMVECLQKANSIITDIKEGHFFL